MPRTVGVKQPMPQQLQRSVKRGQRAQRLARAATARGLIIQGDAVLVSVSGGPDSVALLAVLVALAPRFTLTLHVVHFNHGLRGAESDADERFVVSMCHRMKVPCHCEHLDMTDRDCTGESLQQMAREQRYASLSQLAVQLGANKIALGHTADDQAETVLLWMLRGAGTSGLAGMPARRGAFVRPLLDVSRDEILTYLEEVQLTFRTDSSNASSAYLRNRIRHDLLPVLKRLRPAVVRLLCRQADILREEDRCLEVWTAEQVLRLAHEAPEGHWDLARESFLTLPVAIQRRILRRLFRHVTGRSQGPAFHVIVSALNRVVHGQARTIVIDGVRMTLRRSVIRIAKVHEDPKLQTGRVEDDRSRDQQTLPISVTLERLSVASSEVTWPLTGQTVTFRETVPNMSLLRTSRTVALLDADRFTMALQLRTWQSGDSFHPLGMQGRRKKVKEFFIDQKVPREVRRRVPLLVAPEGILWVGGYRVDERFRITARTTRCLMVQLAELPHPGKAD